MSISHYRAVLTTVGPVFIGNGNEIKKFEYVYDRRTGIVYVIDTIKMFELLSKIQQLDRFEVHIGKNLNLSEFFDKIGLQPPQYRTISKYSYKAGEDPRNQNIKEFIKNAYGQPYIPGSSLKGAVRTAIIHSMIQNGDKQMIRASDDVFREVCNMERTSDKREKTRIRNNIGRIADRLERDCLNTLKLDVKHETSAVNSIMRGLRISDSEPLTVDRLCLCKKLDVSQNGEKPLNLLRECIMPETQVCFDLDIDSKNFPYDKKYLNDSFDLHYDIQEWQMSQFSKFPTYKPSKAEHCLVLSGGSGYVSKTFTHLLMGEDDDKDLKTVSQILSSQFIKHGHQNDIRQGVSPHIRKMTTVDKRYCDFGICRIEFQGR